MEQLCYYNFVNKYSVRWFSKDKILCFSDPEMTILVDDEDKTDSFDPIPTSVSPQGSGPLGEKVKEIKLSMTMTDPPTDWNKKKISCEAKLPDYEAEVVTALIDVKCKISQDDKYTGHFSFYRTFPFLFHYHTFICSFRAKIL